MKQLMSAVHVFCVATTGSQQVLTQKSTGQGKTLYIGQQTLS